MGDVQVAVRRGEPWVYAMRATLQRVSTLDNVRNCGKPWKDWVGVKVSLGGQEWRADGVHSCCSCWLCPVCWSARRIQERGEIVYASESWAGSGGGMATTTITVPHRLGESLDDVWGRVRFASEDIRSRRARATLRDDFGIEHIIRATEITFGRNGWHPHEHWLMFVRGPVTEVFEAGLFRWIRDRWRKRATVNPNSPLYRPEKDPYLPQDVRRVDPENYQRVANHITKGGSKSTEERFWQAMESENEELAAYLAPFVIGEQAAAGDTAMLAVWREYEATTFGKSWIRWSNGFRSDLGLGAAGTVPAMEGDVVQYVHGSRWNDKTRQSLRARSAPA